MIEEYDGASMPQTGGCRGTSMGDLVMVTVGSDETCEVLSSILESPGPLLPLP